MESRPKIFGYSKEKYYLGCPPLRGTARCAIIIEGNADGDMCMDMFGPSVGPPLVNQTNDEIYRSVNNLRNVRKKETAVGASLLLEIQRGE